MDIHDVKDDRTTIYECDEIYVGNSICCRKYVVMYVILTCYAICTGIKIAFLKEVCKLCMHFTPTPQIA